MKRISVKILYIVVALFCVLASVAQAQFTSFVTTKEAHGISRNSAIIALELPDENFVKHGFAFKSLSEGLGNNAGTGPLTKTQIGNCLPDIIPDTSNPYSKNRYRELKKENLIADELYYYYGCAEDPTGKIIEGDIQFFKTLPPLCSVSSATFGKISGVGGKYFNGTETELSIQTKGDCSEGLNVVLRAIGKNLPLTHEIHAIDKIPGVFYPDLSTKKIVLKFELGESGCYTDNDEDGGSGNWGYECVTYVQLQLGSEIIFNLDPVLTPENIKGKADSLRSQGILVGSCSASGCSNDNWEFIEKLEGSTTDTSNCKPTKDDISFSNLGKIISNKNPILSINTTGCKGIKLGIALWDTTKINEPIVINSGETSAKYFFFIPSGDKVTFSFHSSEYACSASNTPDCQIYVQLQGPHGIITTKEALDEYINDWESLEHLKHGVILANCETPLCKTLIDTILSSTPVGLQLSAFGVFSNENWTLKSVTGVLDQELNTSLNINLLDLQLVFDPESPCYDASLNNGKGGYAEDCYELLAPIPGVGKTEASGRSSIDFSQYELGQYIQTIFNVALGILMLLAVIMIIVAGVEYMTVESIFGKSKAKGRITGAATGLILGLGIVIILQTINPQLLEINFGSKVETKTIGFGPIADTTYLNTIDVGGIPDVDLTTMLENDAFVIYISHQQGKAGASSIFYSVKNGSNKVSQNPYFSPPGTIQKNVDNQFKKPTELDYFLNYFYKRVEKFSKSDQRGNIPQEYTIAIKKASTEIGVDYDTMVTMCMIESYMCTKNVDNKQGYRGLFQFGEAAWAEYGRGNYLQNVFDPYENSLAAAKMFKDNISIKNRFK